MRGLAAKQVKQRSHEFTRNAIIMVTTTPYHHHYGKPHFWGGQGIYLNKTKKRKEGKGDVFVRPALVVLYGIAHNYLSR